MLRRGLGADDGAHLRVVVAGVSRPLARSGARIVPDLIQQAEARGVLRQTVAEWPHKEFQLQQCDALVGETETFLYEGDARSAADILERQWPGLARANLLGLQFYRILMTGLRGRVNLTRARDTHGCAAKRLLRSARRDAGRLVKQKAQWAFGLGSLLEAGAATVEQRPDVAMRHLHAAQTCFAASRMEHYLAATRLRMFQLDHRHTAEYDLAMQWMREQGIVAHARIADMLAPGLYPSLTPSHPS